MVNGGGNEAYHVDQEAREGRPGHGEDASIAGAAHRPNRKHTQQNNAPGYIHILSRSGRVSHETDMVGNNEKRTLQNMNRTKRKDGPPPLPGVNQDVEGTWQKDQVQSQIYIAISRERQRWNFV